MLCYEIGYLQLFTRALFSLAPTTPQVGAFCLDSFRPSYLKRQTHER